MKVRFNSKRAIEIVKVVGLIFILLISLRFILKFSTKSGSNVPKTNILRSLEIEKTNLPRSLACIVKTQASMYERAISVYKTWGKDCDELIFIASNFTDLIPIPIPYEKAIPYQNLTTQMYDMFPKIYAKYSHFNWFLVADDNTFVNINHLNKFLREKNPNEDYIYGYFYNDYLSGGAGYVIPNRAFKKLVNAIATPKFCQNTGIDDIDIIYCLKKLNCILANTKNEVTKRERFHPYGLRQHLIEDNKECCATDYISFHYITPNLMMHMYKHKENISDFFDMIMPVLADIII